MRPCSRSLLAREWRGCREVVGRKGCNFQGEHSLKSSLSFASCTAASSLTSHLPSVVCLILPGFGAAWHPAMGPLSEASLPVSHAPMPSATAHPGIWDCYFPRIVRGIGQAEQILPYSPVPLTNLASLLSCSSGALVEGRPLPWSSSKAGSELGFLAKFLISHLLQHGLSFSETAPPFISGHLP